VIVILHGDARGKMETGDRRLETGDRSAGRKKGIMQNLPIGIQTFRKLIEENYLFTSASNLTAIRNP